MRRSLRKIKKTEQQQPQNNALKDSKASLNLTQHFPPATITHYKDPPKRVLKSSQINRLLASRQQMQSVSSQRTLDISLGVRERFRQLCGSDQVIRGMIGEYGIREEQLLQVEEVVFSRCCSQGGDDGLQNIVLEAMKKKVGMMRCEVACRERESYISSLFDQRIERLQTLLNKK